MTYYKLENGLLKKCETVELIDGKYVSNPTAQQLAKINGFPRDKQSFIQPQCEPGYQAVFDRYDSSTGVWKQLWKIVPIQYTYNDYNNAMEDYIRQTYEQRGYIEREPSAYINDPFPRFAQDAQDYVEFRSKVMQYGLPILNELLNNGSVPSMEEFKAGFPKIAWTYE
jgi:hypothetical protein